MKSRIYTLLSVAAFMVFGLSTLTVTANSQTTSTEIMVDNDCDKCKDAKCDGKCDQEHKCTEECKKNGKCTHAESDHKCTDACKKDGKCTHKAEAKKEETKKSCGEKKSCGNHKECGKH